ncbi:MAG: hypothetical protein R3F34_19465 [Planctomycetota bacterium]
MNRLDQIVRSVGAALRDRKVRRPAALVVMGTGLDLFPERLDKTFEIELAELGDVPAPWNRARLVTGRHGDLDLWLLEDLSLDDTDGGPDWQRAFPCWLAARAGARALVLATAGAGLVDRFPPGSLAVVKDHVDLSASRTLVGLADSELGPLFPDQTRLHVESLRHEAVALASEIGVDLHTAVAACVAGPRLETPAEARYYRSAGAEVSVQGLGHLLAGSVHAGLGALVLVAVAGTSGQAADLRRILEHAEKLAPTVEEIVLRLSSPLAEYAANFDAEEA